MDLFRREWKILHRDYERYERSALTIKLFAVAICLLCWLFSLSILVSSAFVAVVWLLEGIWKTFQTRIGARLLAVEKMMRIQESAERASAEHETFQLYSAWSASRKNPVKLMFEYIVNALRPTVAYPYVILLLMTVASEMM